MGAFQMLRAYARRTNARMRDVAEQITTNQLSI